jgi:hypothetical protein
MRHYYIDADVLIKNIEHHKTQMKDSIGSIENYYYEKAHDHIIDIIKLMKDYAICLDEDD